MYNFILGLALIYCGHIGRLDVVTLTYLILFFIIPYYTEYCVLNRMGYSISVKRQFLEFNEHYRTRMLNILLNRANARNINTGE